MAVTDFSIDHRVGINFNRRTTAPDYALGETAKGTNNTVWIYGQASGAVSVGPCTVNATTFLITDTSGTYTADTAFADGEYGWVRQTAGFTA